MRGVGGVYVCRKNEMNPTEVKNLQRMLRETVAPGITVDGLFGRQTTEAIQQYARQHKVDATTALSMLQASVKAKYIGDAAYKEAADILGVKVSYVRAIAEVETSGSAFLPDGQMKILFERHWFYKKLKQAMISPIVSGRVANIVNMPGLPIVNQNTPIDKLLERVILKFENICSPSRGGYKGDAQEWDRLHLAMTLDVEAACQAASYGGFQLMGFNHQLCGYPTAEAMMHALSESESKQLLAMVSFVKSQPAMLACLKKGDWAGFAEKYNGSAYKENSYDVKLARGEERWRSANLA
jgi:hypothetical protein